MDTIKFPRSLKAKVMLWTDISYHDMEELDKMQSICDLERSLCGLLRIDLPEPKRAVLLELYVQAVLFCRGHHFSREQTSTLLSIIKSIHDLNVETPLNNTEQCVSYCRELLLCHSVRRPPFSINLFGSKEVQCVFEYIHNSYFKNFKLYKYIFTPQVKLDLSFTYCEIAEQEGETTNNSSTADIEDEHDTQQGNMGQEEAASDSTSEVKTLIEQEVRKQIAFVSGQLDQRMKEMALEHNSVSQASHPKKDKKQ